jgi:hypothetical protein
MAGEWLHAEQRDNRIRLVVNGGVDETRTRDLLRDRQAF